LAPADTFKLRNFLLEANSASGGHHFPCEDPVRYKMNFIPGETLEKLGIRYAKFIQKPGQIVVTLPQCWHQVLNLGLCLNSAVNFTLGIRSLDLPILSWRSCPAE